MLLWLRNLGFSGSETVFFISGEIPIKDARAIIARYEAQITVESDGKVSAPTS